MTADRNVEIIARETAFQGYFRVDRYRLRHSLHDGGLSPALTREVFERGHVAAVLPYDPGRDEVVLIEQFRIGALAAAKPAWCVEIVAGVIDEGETAQSVARREIIEEIGCAPDDLVPIHDYLVSPGGTSETVALFCGRIDASKAGGIHGNADEHEDIRVFTRPAAEAIAGLSRGEYTNALTLIGLQWLALNRDDLRRRWNGQ